MKKIKYYVPVAAALIRESIQSRLEYPFMLIGHVLANCVQWVVGFVTIKFVVDSFGSLGGWGYESLAFLYGGESFMNMIKVSHLVKEYKKIKKEKGLYGAVKNLFVQDVQYVRAVDDISFEVEKGDIVAYIGPNGAGKSTTVKMLSGILQPTGGEILINGISPQRDRKRVVKNLGVVFGQRSQLNWNLRLGETFDLLKRIYQIDDALYDKNIKMHRPSAWT